MCDELIETDASHPDKNPGKEEAASSKFVKITAAHERMKRRDSEPDDPISNASATNPTDIASHLSSLFRGIKYD